MSEQGFPFADPAYKGNPYQNRETYVVALTLENEQAANDRLIERAIQKGYQLTPNDVKEILTDEPWAIYRSWPKDEFVSRRKVNWQLLAESFNELAREYSPDFRYIPNEGPIGRNQAKPDADEVAINASIAQVIPILRELTYVEDFDDCRVFLPQQRLQRKLYEAVDRVLVAFGGSWHRELGAHVFEESPAAQIREVIDTGKFVKPYNFGYFPTQKDLVESLMEGIHFEPGMLLLEPEMGQGHIADVVSSHHPEVTIHGFEINPKNHAKVSDRYPCVLGDFLQQEPQAIYDIVFMNPPFEKQQDIDHALHAMKFLKPGGQFTCIMGAGVASNSDNKSKEFRALIERLGGVIEKNPDGAFKASGTSVSTITTRITHFPGLEAAPQMKRRAAMA